MKREVATPVDSTTVENFSQIKTISLKSHPTIAESWVQQVLFENPSILGLGTSVKAIDKERTQYTGGRLDLLLQDDKSNNRYEVEIQLGATDEKHIIRTIEYWDIERKRYPDFEHVAVIVAEDITSRFYNVISLFNSAIPLIAIKLTAIEQENGSIGLLFTRVLDWANKSVNQDEGQTELTDRGYWDKKVSKKVLQSIDKILESIHSFEPSAQLNYCKPYIGIRVDRKPCNFVIFHPRKDYFYISIKLERSDKVDELLESNQMEDYEYRTGDGRYRIHIDDSLEENKLKILQNLLEIAHENY